MNQNQTSKLLIITILLSAFLNQNTILDIVIEVLWIVTFVLAFLNDFGLGIGIIAGSSFFSSQLYVPFTNFLLFNMFLLLFILLYAIKYFGKSSVIRFEFKMFIYIVVMLLYVLLILNPYVGKTTQTITAFSSVITACIFMGLFKEDNIFVVYAKYYIVAAVSACIFGYLNISSFILMGGVNRFCGTNADPNYFGCSIIVALIMLGLFKNRIPRWLYIVIGVFIAINAFFTGSNTAAIALCLILIVNIIANTQSTSKTVAMCVFVAIAGLLFITFRDSIASALYNFNTTNTYLNRYMTTLGQLLSSGLSNDATSGRSGIAAGYMDAFSSFSIFEKLFGGHVSGVYGVDGNYGQGASFHVTHNFNIDVLFSIGIVGLVVVYWIFFSRLRDAWQKKDESVVSRQKIVLKIVMLLYTFSLSFFMSFNPTLFFLF